MNFINHYDNEIAPIVKKLYNARKRGTLKALVAKVIVLCIGGVVIYCNSFHHFIVSFWGWLTAGVLFIVFFSLTSLISNTSNDTIRYTILQKIFSFFSELEFRDIRYGSPSQKPIDDMKVFLFPHQFDGCSNSIKITGKFNNRQYDIYLLSFYTKMRTDKTSTLTYKKSLLIHSETSFETVGKVVLVPEYMNPHDRSEWNENNLIKKNTIILEKNN